MCLNFILVKIGCDNDNTIKIVTSVLVDVMNSVEQSNINTVGTDSFQISNITVNNNGTIKCKDGFSIYQGNIALTSIVNTFNSQQLDQINTQIVSKIEDTLSQQQTEGILAFLNSLGQAGSVTNSQDITNKVKESVSNAIKQTAINELWAGTRQSNGIVLNNNGLIEGDACNIIQKNSLDVRITNIATSLQTNLQNEAFLNTLLDYSNQSQTSASLAWLKWVFLAIIAVVVLIVIGVLLYFIFGSKGGGTPTDQSKQDLKANLQRRVMEKKEGVRNRGASSSLAELERGAEARTGTGGTGRFLSPETEGRLRNLADRFGRRME